MSNQVNNYTNLPLLGVGAVSYTHLTLPTSDSSVDLGGRRIIKKKKRANKSFRFRCSIRKRLTNTRTQSTHTNLKRHERT